MLGPQNYVGSIFMVSKGLSWNVPIHVYIATNVFICLEVNIRAGPPKYLSPIPSGGNPWLSCR
jgi:hypothetical protein